MKRATPRLTAERRKEQLLRAAAVEFAEGGYTGTQIEAIVARAGVTKPVLYRHFDSKTGLYLELLERHAKDMPGFLTGPVGVGEVEARFTEILDRWFSYVEANPYGWRMLFRDAGGGTEIEAYREAVRARARALIADFLRESPAFDLPPSLVEPIAELIRGGLAALALWSQENSDSPRSALVAAGARLIAGVAESDLRRAG